MRGLAIGRSIAEAIGLEPRKSKGAVYSGWSGNANVTISPAPDTGVLSLSTTRHAVEITTFGDTYQQFIAAPAHTVNFSVREFDDAWWQTGFDLDAVFGGNWFHGHVVLREAECVTYYDRAQWNIRGESLDLTVEPA